MSDLKLTISKNPFKDLEKVTKKAKSRALSRALPFAKKKITQVIKDNYTVQTSAVKEAMSVHKEDDSAQIIIIGPPLGIDKFSYKPKYDTTGATQRSVRVSVKRNVQRTVGNGFVWQGHVFRRVGDARRPVEKVTGPAVPQLIEDPQILDEISEETQDYFEERLQHELDYELSKNGNK